MTSLINNILDFSRIEAGKKEYSFRETDVADLVRSTLESYRFEIEQNGFQFEQKIDNNLPPLRVDREAIARSLLNLVNNAVKYSATEKYLGVYLYRHNGGVNLEVVDHGIGIPAKEQPKIFEKFYRVGDPLVHNTKGSGLGLSLVRHIVQAHGGEVAVESAPGHGSKFIITLPVQASEVQQGEACRHETARENQSQRRTDDPGKDSCRGGRTQYGGWASRQFRVRRLRSDYRERWSRRPSTRARRVSRPGGPRRHDASHERPGSLQAATRQARFLPIIMLTARGQEVDKVVGLELGADDYVTKPFSIRELLARVKAVLRRTAVLPKDQDQHSFGDVEVDLRRCRVLRSGKALDVSSKEFELLKYFICHSGETLSRDRLLEEVWGYEHYPTTRTVDTHLVRLRQKLEPNPEQPQYFLTVHGTGYRFVG